jgi:hypothetical protein
MRSDRRLRRCRSSLLIVLGLGLAGAPTAGAQAPEATLLLDDASVTAGDDVLVTGTCPAGSSAVLHVFGDEPPQGEVLNESFQGHKTIPAADSFSESVPIPQEAFSGTWRIAVSCFGADGTGPSAEKSLTVASTTAEPIALQTDPGPIRAGEPVRVTGSGCRIDGRALGQATVELLWADGRELRSVRAEATPSPDGRFEVTLEPPASFAQGGGLVATCYDLEESGLRYRRMHAERARATGPTTTTGVTPPPTQELPRTGPGGRSGWLALLGAALGWAGVVLLTSGRRRGGAAREG